MSSTHKGEYSVIASVLLWSLFPVLSLLCLQTLPPIFTLAVCTGIATCTFAGMLLFKKKPLWNIPQEARSPVLRASLLLGVVYYVFVFLGLQFTSANNAGMIELMEVCFAFLVTHFWAKEKIDGSHALGAGFMLMGAVFVVWKGGIQHINPGDILILLATCVAPFGNFYAQKARKILSSMEIMFIRSFISTPILFGISLLLEKTPPAHTVLTALPNLLFIGMILFSWSKILWVEGLSRISVSKASSFFPLGLAFTFLFSFLLLKEVPNVWQILGLVPMVFGVMILTKKKRKS